MLARRDKREKIRGGAGDNEKDGGRNRGTETARRPSYVWKFLDDSRFTYIYISTPVITRCTGQMSGRGRAWVCKKRTWVSRFEINLISADDTTRRAFMSAFPRVVFHFSFHIRVTPARRLEKRYVREQGCLRCPAVAFESLAFLIALISTRTTRIRPKYGFEYLRFFDAPFSLNARIVKSATTSSARIFSRRNKETTMKLVIVMTIKQHTYEWLVIDAFFFPDLYIAVARLRHREFSLLSSNYIVC